MSVLNTVPLLVHKTSPILIQKKKTGVSFPQKMYRFFEVFCLFENAQQRKGRLFTLHKQSL